MAQPHSPTGPYSIISSGRIPWFAALLESADRERPAVVVSPKLPEDLPVIDPGLISYDVNSVADVYLLADNQAAWRLSEATDPAFHTYNGAVRLIFPVWEGRDSHPIFLDRGDPTQIPPTIARVLGLKSRSPRERPRPLTVVPNPAAARENRIGDLEKQIRGLKADLKKANGRIVALTEEARADQQPVFSDPEQQFHHELGLTWLRTIPEPERGKYGLRDYTLGAEFLESIQIADRRKVLLVTVDVLTRRMHDLSSRSPHQQRESESSGTTLVRDDGAVAWRCNVQTNTAAAQRLMWWELTDGSVELGRVATHDDTKLR